MLKLKTTLQREAQTAPPFVFSGFFNRTDPRDLECEWSGTQADRREARVFRGPRRGDNRPRIANRRKDDANLHVLSSGCLIRDRSRVPT